MQAKSLYRSRAGRHFYGTENVIWPIGNTEKKFWADYEQFLRVFFSCFQGQKQDRRYSDPKARNGSKIEKK